MRVVLDARLRDGEPGGVQQAVLGLAAGLAELHGGGDEYLFLVHPEHDWLRPALTGPCQPLVTTLPTATRTAVRAARAVRGRAPTLGRVLEYAASSGPHVLPAPDAAVEAARPDVVHFLLQRGFRTRRPNIYQPHDLQHVHHPEFFSPLHRAYRRIGYRAMAQQASRVAVMSASGMDDVVTHLSVPRERVIVVPWASTLADDAGLPAEIPAAVPPRYVLYPAQSWPHKNHLRLVAALAVLRRRYGLDIPLVLTGRPNEHWPVVAAELRRCGVEDLVVHLGFVTPEVLRTLYHHAVGMVFPSLFEGWGLPVVEAFTLGVPVACSRISPLTEIAQDAALMFDPLDADDIAAALARLWTDGATREQLAMAGRARGSAFDWARTAALFRAHYRTLLRGEVTDQDRELLTAQPSV